MADLQFKRIDLQLFADGSGDGGAGAGDGAAAATATATVENSPADGETRLKELGVPDSVLQKRANRRAQYRSPKQAAKPEQEKAEPTKPVAAAESSTPEAKTEEPPAKRLTWDEIVADPEYNKQIQSTIQARLRSAKSAEDAMSKLAPAIDVLAKYHGLDTANMDYEALAKAIADNDIYYEDSALMSGKTIDQVKQEQQQESRKREEERTIQQEKIQKHISSLEKQGEALKQMYPSFDLIKELQNPTFRRLTSPDSGLSLEDAYVAVHRKELMTAAMQVTAQRTAQQMANNIRAGQMRPVENGTSAQAASNTSFDYAHASREQREALKRQIREAAARGEKIYPGQF